MLINLCLTVEPTPNEEEEAFLDSAVAELKPMETRRRPPRFNWRAIMDIDRTSEPLHRHLPANPFLNERTFNILDNLRHDYEGVTVYPYGSKKGVSSRSIAATNDILRSLGEPIHRHFSASELLDLWFKHGIQTSEPCEMRQKWYPTGLKPRTYYAQGSSALFASTYLRQFFNELADRFEYTNRFTRVDGSRLISKTPDGSSFLVYDFSNFTSNFSEQFYFLTSLGEMFRGCMVALAGPDLTYSDSDLGELILEYRDVCNDQPEYYTEVVMLEFMANLDFRQIQAGFLGVYGNLMTCTVPHGIVARSLVDQDCEVGCAGDDGAIDPALEEDIAVRNLLELGDFAPDKVFKKPFVYLKRKLEFLEHQGHLTEMFIFPNLSLASTKFGYVPSRFRHLTDYKWDYYRFSTYQSIRSLVRSFSRSGVHVSFEESRIATRTLNSLMRFCDLSNPDQTYLRLTASGDLRKTVPMLYELPENFFSTGRVEPYYPEWGTHAIINCRRRKRSSHNLHHGFIEGDTIELNNSAKVDYVRRCGYLEPLPLDQEYDFDLVRLSDIASYAEIGPVITRYRVVKDLPPEQASRAFGIGPDERLNKRVLAVEEFERFRRSRRDEDGLEIDDGWSMSRYVDLDRPVLSTVDELVYEDADVVPPSPKYGYDENELAGTVVDPMSLYEI
jgi:hypothetical protein